MNASKHKFIQLALDHHVLRLGEFTLKSGRKSPYFFNAGMFYQNTALREVGQYYADIIATHHLPCQHLFGPAYKGLPLATATAIALAERSINTTVTFNRKEAKDHGEGGNMIGAPLSGPTIIIDDVITAGTAFREAKQCIELHGGQVTAVVIAFDRCERGLKQQSTLAEIASQGIHVYSIITLFDLIDYLQQQHMSQEVEQLLAYHKEWGCP